MSIFQAMDEFSQQKALPILKNVNRKILDARKIVDTVKGALKKARSLLKAVETGLNNLSNMARNLANSLKLNPLGNGPLKILFKMVIAFLKAASSVFRATANLINAFRAKFSGGVQIRIETKLKNIDEKLLDLIMKIADVRGKLFKIQRVARKLQEQEHLITAAGKTEIVAKFTQKFYSVLPPKDLIIRAYLKELNKMRKYIDDKVKEVQEAAKVLSFLAKAVAAINNTVGAVIRTISEIATKIKKWIDEKIKVLGWLLDSIDWVINKALKLFGFDKLKKWVARRLGNIPFVKEAKEFKAKVDAIFNEIDKKLEDFFKQLDTIAKNIEETIAGTIGADHLATYNFIKSIKIKKPIIEKKIPKAVAGALNGINQLLEDLPESEEENLKTKEKNNVLSLVKTQNEAITSILAIESPEFFEAEMTKMSDIVLENYNTLSKSNDLILEKKLARETVIDLLIKQKPVYSKLDEQANIIREATSEFDDSYFETLIDEIGEEEYKQALLEMGLVP